MFAALSAFPPFLKEISPFRLKGYAFNRASLDFAELRFGAFLVFSVIFHYETFAYEKVEAFRPYALRSLPLSCFGGLNLRLWRPLG